MNDDVLLAPTDEVEIIKPDTERVLGFVMMKVMEAYKDLYGHDAQKPLEEALKAYNSLFFSPLLIRK